MKLIITKFFKDQTYTNTYLPDNYFSQDGIDVVDYIIIDKIPKDGIPIFSEELTQPGEPLQFKSGDYDVKLSMLIDTKSNLGLSVQDFFTLDKKYIIRVIVSGDSGLRSFGFIDISSIKFNYNLTDGSYISFTVYSGELEWHNFAMSKKFDEFEYINQGRHGTWDENDMSFGVFMSYFLDDTNVIMDNRTNLDERILQQYGFTPKTSPLQQVFVNETYWQVFKDIIIGFGVMYKIVPNETYCKPDQWGQPNMILFYRADGLDISELKILEREDSYISASNSSADSSSGDTNGFYSNETFMMLISKYNNSQGANTKYEGFINNTDSRALGGIYCFDIEDVFNVYDGWDISFYRNGVQEYMFREKKCVLDSGLKLVNWSYNDFGKWGDGNDEKNYTSACRFFVNTYEYTIPSGGQYYLYDDDGFQHILEGALSHVYDFLIAALKKSLTLKIVNDDLFDTSIYNKASFNNTDFWIEKVYDADLYNKTAKVKLIEI